MKKAPTQSRKRAAKSKTAPPPAAPPSPPALAVAQQEQSRTFDKAIALFHAGNFAQAEGLFENAAAGPAREMSHVARVHARICAQKTNRAALTLTSAEDHYNYAVALINRRELPAAERHLLAALELAPDGDHLHYALALSLALRGEIQQACESLRRAIELDPRNRVQARTDPDFAEFIHQPRVAALLFSGKEQRC